MQNQRRTKKTINNFETSFETKNEDGNVVTSLDCYGVKERIGSERKVRRKKRFNEGKEGEGKEHCYGKWMEIHDGIFSK